MLPSGRPVSRREFARRAAIGAASASLLPLGDLAKAANHTQDAPAQPAGDLKLSSQSQLEAEARWKAILEQYSDRFTDAQRADLKRLCIFVQPALDRIRAYPAGNVNAPDLYLKPLVERDKKPAAPAAGKTSRAKKS